MYCLDTNIFVDWLRGDSKLDVKIKSVQDEGIFMTSVTLCELYRGAYLSSKKDHSLAIIEDLLEDIEIIELTKDACKEFGKDFASLDKLGVRTQDSDLMIASIAKAHNLILITRDKKHFANIDIKLEVW